MRGEDGEWIKGLSGELQPIYCSKCGKLLDYTTLPIYDIEASCKPDCTNVQSRKVETLID